MSDAGVTETAVYTFGSTTVTASITITLPNGEGTCTYSGTATM
jgi:hypothetical protein